MSDHVALRKLATRLKRDREPSAGVESPDKRKLSTASAVSGQLFTSPVNIDELRVHRISAGRAFNSSYRSLIIPSHIDTWSKKIQQGCLAREPRLAEDCRCASPRHFLGRIKTELSRYPGTYTVPEWLGSPAAPLAARGRNAVAHATRRGIRCSSSGWNPARRSGRRRTSARRGAWKAARTAIPTLLPR